MKIGELAARAGVTTKAVRYYESLGLITPGRLANGYRNYEEADVRLIREIRSLRELGIQAERARPFLQCLAAGSQHADDCPASLAGYRHAIDELTRQIGALTARRAALAAHLRAAAHRHSIVPAVNQGDPVTDLYQLPPNLPVPEDDRAADHLSGMPMPPIDLPATGGGVVRLNDLGPGRTVLYIYPLTGRPDTDLPEGWDAIPGARGCTPEACDFRDHHQDLLDAGAGRVFGLSSQDTAYQRETVARLRLPFQMLSDPALTLADALNLPTFEAGGMRLFTRLTLVVKDDRIEHVFYPIFPPNEHAQQVLAWLRGDPPRSA
ncbi:MerR family transcriptional regulator [Micromonospora phytophila]|uniref:MerR family transcriptional regulator n=1 Tax=Micromonospora phytophila TaxID=709888 RepID=UPI00202E0EB3|nr:MerR family transcriptional regulator [Micromonospora phytophila]MCM0673666.1 MerR family transcriptional regulator [Micromonospora phytophila]